VPNLKSSLNHNASVLQGVDWINVEGPISPAGSNPRAIFENDAREALAAFLPHVFRRPFVRANSKSMLSFMKRPKQAANRTSRLSSSPSQLP
jgi:hypothetical protein